MTLELLIDMFYAAPEFWYFLGALLACLIGLLIFEAIKVLKLKQKNYFLNRDRERYAETLYASKDGYFAFIYPDQKVNDPRNKIMERCSRRLAVILNLPMGTASSFEEVLQCFYKDDAKKVQKYCEMLLEDGVSFEDEFCLKNNNKYIRLSGSRINGIDGNIYCDMIWFRDVSFETTKIDKLEEEKDAAEQKIMQMEDLINNIPYPIWLRDEKLDIALFNKKYIEYTGCKNKEEVLEKKAEILNINGESASKNTALLAHTANRTKKANVNIIRNGERYFMETIETPFHMAECLDKICTAGALIDISELDDIKRNLKLHQNAHLEILGTLGTAFAVFDNQFKLSFYNQSFADLWKLENVWLEQKPNYSMFLDVIREKRMLPEVPDYILFKNEEQKEFNSIIEAKEDLLHLPNGQTFRRVRAPHPMGGLIFAFEDVSDKLAARRAYNSLLSIQQETLDNLFDAVLIFGQNDKLQAFNQAYVDLWNVSSKNLQKEPTLSEVVEMQKPFFAKADDWQSLKNDIINHLCNITTKTFVLNRNDADEVEVLSSNLSDGSMMITYKKISS